jgi:hypothetical protein
MNCLESLNNRIPQDLELYLNIISTKYITLIPSFLKELSKYTDVRIEFRQLNRNFFGYYYKDESVVVNSKFLTEQSFPMVVFLIFHEMGHVMQYRKAGYDVHAEIFSDTDKEEFFKNYIELEKDANKFALERTMNLFTGDDMKYYQVVKQMIEYLPPKPLILNMWSNWQRHKDVLNGFEDFHQFNGVYDI